MTKSITETTVLSYLSFLAFLKGIKITCINEQNFRLTKNNKELIVKKKKLTWRNPLTIKNNFDKINLEYKNVRLAITLFNKIFSYSAEDKINLAKDFEINFFGKTIITDFEQLKEIDYGILGYNKYYKLKNGDIVFDLGGYHGLYSIWASEIVGATGKVYCFEPDVDNQKILLENIKRNNLTNIIVIPFAVSNKTTTTSFFKRGHGSRIVTSDFKTNSKDALTTIQSIKLSDYLTEQNIQKIDFIKADIEGEEVEFVEDYLTNILPLGIFPHMAIASYHYRKEIGTNTSLAIAKEFKKNGIKVNIGNKKHECVFV